MDEIDVTWQAMMARFWRWRRWELLLHGVLFGIINVLLLADPYGLTLVATAPPMLRQIGIDNIPWLTIHWTTVLGVHGLVVASAAVWSRVFRAGMARELSGTAVLADEKPKNRRDEVWDDAWGSEEAGSGMAQPLKRQNMGQK